VQLRLDVLVDAVVDSGLVAVEPEDLEDLENNQYLT
jgi:hypothetical protein